MAPVADRTARLAAALLVVAMPALAAAGPGIGPGGWRERSLGWLTGFPERKVKAAGGAFEAEFLLAPGTGIALENGDRRPVAGGETASITLFADDVNRTSRDYEADESHFPVSVTFVFGEDRIHRPLKRRVLAFFSNLVHGFPPAGVRLTYAWGNRVPAGSMYRLAEGETVFTLAGEDDAGRRVTARRHLSDDFAAAYGRPPSGPVTGVIIRAERPRREKGSCRAAALLVF